jgi:cell pole-organizing protein PopZ
MEEILASIRRIIADDDPTKNQPKASEPPAPPPRPAPPPPRMAPPPPPPPPPEPEPEQDEIDSMLAQLEQVSRKPPPPSVEESASDILDLTEQMAAPEEAPAFRTIDGQSDVVFEESPPEPEPPPPPPRMVEPPRPVPDQADRGLMSASTSAAVDSAFNTLAQTVLVQNGRTLEDLVREMLRPMLKTWLDDNLPSMVERLVRAEIERVSRGRG